MSQLTEQLAQQDLIEWIGLLAGIIYVVLASYERPSCWVFGIISSACIAWKSYTDYLLIADTVLQIFYIGVGVFGLLVWYKGEADSKHKAITFSSWTRHLLVIAGCVLISWPLSWLLLNFTDARYGFLDTLLTCLSVWATILLIRKDLHNWVYWIGIDIIYVILYWKTDGFLFALLFMIYTIISVWGLWRWSITLKEEKYIRNIG